MVGDVIQFLATYLLWIAVMGIGQFIYDYQTLITGAGAIGAAYVAARPVYRQLDIMKTQSDAVRRDMLLQRQLEIEQSSVSVKENVGRKMDDLSREFPWWDEDTDESLEISEHQAHHHDQNLSSAVYWLRLSYKWRDNVDAEAKRETLIAALDKLIDILQDVHGPAHHDQHGEDYSMSDADYAVFVARGQAAKSEVYPALTVAKSALQTFLDSLSAEVNAIFGQLKALDRTLVSGN